MTDHDAKEPNGQPEFDTHLQDESSAVPDAAAMQDMQLSLVDRIADVDDERRRSSTQLRKALQTHKDEVEQRLVGYRRALIALSALAGLLTAGMIGLGLTLYAQRGEVTQQIADIDTVVPSGDETSAPPAIQLVTQVADIDRRLSRLASQLGEVEPAALWDSVQMLSVQIEGMQAKLQSLTDLPNGLNADDVATVATAAADGIDAEAETGSIAATEFREDAVSMAEPERQMEAIAAVTETPTSPAAHRPIPDQTAAADLDAPTADQAPEPSPDQASEQESDRLPERLGLQADTSDIRVEQRRLEAQIAAARNELIGSQQPGTLPVDQLIDDQLERLEREYQRLARQVDAPAVQPAGAQAFAGAGLASGARLALSADATTSAPNDSSSDDESGGMTTEQAWIALQLIGFRSRDEVRAFINEHNLPGPLYLRSETYRGRPWYALIRSLHEDMESAAAARDALPEDLARLDIWLRELPAGTGLERIGPDANN